MSIIEKIGLFFKRLFNKQQLLKESATQGAGPVIDTNVMKFEIDYKISHDLEINRLKNEFDNGNIEENELTAEQALEIKKLYENEINYKKNVLNRKKDNLFKKIMVEDETTDLFKKFNEGQIDESELSLEQVEKFKFLYNYKIEKQKDYMNNLIRNEA